MATEGTLRSSGVTSPRERHLTDSVLASTLRGLRLAVVGVLTPRAQEPLPLPREETVRCLFLFFLWLLLASMRWVCESILRAAQDLVLALCSGITFGWAQLRTMSCGGWNLVVCKTKPSLL